MKCKFCAEDDMLEVIYNSRVSVVPSGLSRKEIATFNGYTCKYCKSVENKIKFDPNRYIDGYYSGVANYDRPSPSYDYTGNLAKYLKSKKGSILDLGAGQGAFALYLKQLGLDVDVSEPDVGYQKVLSENFNKVFDGIYDLERRFDTVVTVGVLEHVDDPIQHILDVFDKALDSDGELICQYPNVGSLTAKLNFRSWDMLFEAGHNYIPSLKGLEIALNNTDISIEQAYSSSITSRGRIPFTPTRNAGLERIYKKLCDNISLLQNVNRGLWHFQSFLGLGETIIVHLKRNGYNEQS